MRLAVLLPIAAACGDDPSLRVSVKHPADVAVASTVVSVYESDALDCAKVELGDVAAGELEAALVSEATFDAVAGASGGLSNLSRTENKVIVARGYDSGDVFVSAGCVEHGEIEGNDVAKIETEATASVSIGGFGDTNGVNVTVTGPGNTSLGKRVVAWRVYGPSGTEPYKLANVSKLDGVSEWEPTNPACTNGNGVAQIHPMPPSLIGGFATRLRVSWATEPGRVFTSFTKVNLSREVVTPPTIASNRIGRRWCAARRSGSTRRLVCLEGTADDTVIAHDYKVTVTAGAARITDGQTPVSLDYVLGEKVIGAFSVDRGAAVDAYGITTRGRVVNLFGPSMPSAEQPQTGGAVTDVVLAPACGDAPSKLVVRLAMNATDHVIALMDPLGGTYTPSAVNVAGDLGTQLAINRVGCVTELGSSGASKLRQVIVVDTGKITGPDARSSTTAYFTCDANGGSCAIQLPVARAGVAFLPGTEPQLVGSFFDASGTVLSGWVLKPDSDKVDRLVERTRFTAASFPAHLMVGNFDDDEGADFFWDIPNISNSSTNFQVSYARTIDDGERLAALSGAADSLLVIDSFVGRVTDDDRDDVVLQTANTLTPETAGAIEYGLVVIPTGVAPPASDPPPDMPCQ